MLVEEGFEVVSVDASDKMLKYALRQRWKRRTDPAFDRWSESALSSVIFTRDSICHDSAYICYGNSVRPSVRPSHACIVFKRLNYRRNSFTL